MEWIRLFLFCLFTMGLTGAIAYLMVFILSHIGRNVNPFLLLRWQKVVILLSGIPILFTMICLSRMRYMHGSWRFTGIFLSDTSPVLDGICVGSGLIWLLGFLLQMAGIIKERLKLRKILKRNSVVEDEEWLLLIEEHRARFDLSHVEVYRNGFVISPITTGCFQPKIVLPTAEYTEKQRRMILEHEMNHIRSHDLLWRKAGQWMLWVQWYHPVVHFLLKQFIYQQEIVCDIRAGQNNSHYTMKEYGYFLAGLADGDFLDMPTVALCESKKEIVGRIEAMARAGKEKEPGGWRVFVSCLGVALLSLLPAGEVSARAVNAQESNIKSTEAALTYGTVESNESMEIRQEIADPAIREIDLTGEISPYGDFITVDDPVPAYTRIVYGYKEMPAGSSIEMLVNCGDDTSTYRIGIKNKATNVVYYVEGTGKLSGTFMIDEAGKYTAFVENCTGQEISVSGSASYNR